MLHATGALVKCYLGRPAKMEEVDDTAQCGGGVCKKEKKKKNKKGSTMAGDVDAKIEASGRRRYCG